jgi:hypothetical protein
MSLYLEFEPHSWYMGFAIKQNDRHEARNYIALYGWEAYIDDGNTYQIVALNASKLASLKKEIRAYHLRKHTGYGERYAKRRLEYLRGKLKAECISTDEINELVGLAQYIQLGDVQLLEAAGVPEFEGAES